MFLSPLAPTTIYLRLIEMDYLCVGEIQSQLLCHKTFHSFGQLNGMISVVCHQSNGRKESFPRFSISVLADDMTMYLWSVFLLLSMYCVLYLREINNNNNKPFNYRTKYILVVGFGAKNREKGDSTIIARR